MPRRKEGNSWPEEITHRCEKKSQGASAPSHNKRSQGAIIFTGKGKEPLVQQDYAIQLAEEEK